MSSSGNGTAVADCSRFKISETILKTGQMGKMKPWYTTILGVAPFFEHEPPQGAKPGDFGGQTRASDLKMCFFRLSASYPYTQVIGLFEEQGTAAAVPPGSPGLHHMQLMSENFAELIAKYDSLAEVGLRPHRSSNHGPFTSFYYRDPDGNNVELTTQNFPTFEAMTEFMRSPAFKANPSGVELDAEEFVARFKSGESVEDLVRI